MIDNLVVLLMGISVVFIAFRAVRLERRQRESDNAAIPHRRD
jgi:hypothetical protein